jgi:hypothetical protein
MYKSTSRFMQAMTRRTEKSTGDSPTNSNMRWRMRKGVTVSREALIAEMPQLAEKFSKETAAQKVKPPKRRRWAASPRWWRP